MKNEFREAYTKLFENSLTNLRRIIQVKLKAIRYSNKYLLRDSEMGQPSYKTFGGLSSISLDKKMKQIKFDPINQNEVEDCESNIASTSNDEDEKSSASIGLSSNSESEEENKVEKLPKVSFRESVFKKKVPTQPAIEHIKEQLTKKLVKNFALEIYQREKTGADDDEAKKQKKNIEISKLRSSKNL